MRLHLHRRVVRAAHLGEVGGEFFLVVVDHWERRLIRATIVAAAVHHGAHQVDDRLPALLIKAVLQNVADFVTAGAVVEEDVLHPTMLRGVFGESRQVFLPGKLLEEVRELRQQQILTLQSAVKGDFSVRRRIAFDLGPKTVLPGRESRREIVVALLVGENAGGNRLSQFFHRDRDSRHFFFRGVHDCAGQQNGVFRYGKGNQACRATEEERRPQEPQRRLGCPIPHVH